MYYGQVNYPRVLQGTPPVRYTIAQIGCLLVSFCNILHFNGRDVSPVSLNDFFRDHDVYIDSDDGILDDLYWGAVTRFYPRLIVDVVASAGIPPHTNSIVRLRSHNKFGTHFCKVSRIIGDTVYIIDSWDGKEKKSSVYGPITGWATYRLLAKKKKKTISSTYKVKLSDNDGLIATLSRIGLGSKWKWIAHINGLKPPYIIRPGQILRLK